MSETVLFGVIVAIVNGLIEICKWLVGSYLDARKQLHEIEHEHEVATEIAKMSNTIHRTDDDRLPAVYCRIAHLCNILDGQEEIKQGLTDASQRLDRIEGKLS